MTANFDKTLSQMMVCTIYDENNKVEMLKT